MNSPEPPLIKLPANGFTVWTDRERAVKGWEVNELIRLPGRQFTIWTRPELVAKPGEPKSAGISSAVISAPPAKCCRGAWLGRLAAVGLIAVTGLAVWSSYSSRDTIRRLRAEKKEVGLAKIKFYEIARKAQKSGREALAQKTDLETLVQTTGKERDGAKAALATTEQSLKLAEIDAAGKGTKLNEATRELAALKKQLADKELAMTNSLETMKSEKSRLQQAFEQKDLEMKNLTAKADEDKAVALRDAAAAMTQIGELKTQIDGLKKELEALKAAPKPAPAPPAAPASPPAPAPAAQ